MKTELPQYLVIPLGVAFVVAGAALLIFGAPMVIGKGNISFPKR